MQTNIGMPERIARVAAGAALLAWSRGGRRTPWGLVGALPLATGFVGICPLRLAIEHLRGRPPTPRPGSVPWTVTHPPTREARRMSWWPG